MKRRVAVEIDEEPTHDAIVRRLGPGEYRAEDLELGAKVGCGWVGPIRTGPWWESKRAAEADADEHSGREVYAGPKGATPSRPVRMSDDLWLPLVEVADEEGISASEVLRQAAANDPRVAARVAARREALAS